MLTNEAQNPSSDVERSRDAPDRIWLQQDAEGCRPRWSVEPDERRFGLAHVNIEYVRADLIVKELSTLKPEEQSTNV